LLNTVVVGLDAVEKGHQKPDEMYISWDPQDRRVAARLARKFTVEAFIVRVAESLKSYVKTVSKLPQFKSLSEKWQHCDIGAADKLGDICKAIGTDENYLVSAGKLLIRWRNKVAHISVNNLNPTDANNLLKSAEEISNQYAGLEIDRLIVHMKEGRPTIKDVSSLISMAINLADMIDKSAYSSLTKEDVLVLAQHYGIVEKVEAIRRETAKSKIESSVKQCFTTHAPRLYLHFLGFYLPDGSDLKFGVE
jgi:hypothetical protein